MEASRVARVLLAGILLFGFSSCSEARLFGSNTAAKEDFSNCVNRACFKALKFTRPIESERLDEGGERVMYATWLAASWERYALKKEEALYLYYEVSFDNTGSVTNINVGRPFCEFDDNHHRTCRILHADEN